MKLSPRYEAPTIITIAEPDDDQLAPVVRQRQRLAKTLAGLDDAEWSSASALRGLDRPRRRRAHDHRQRLLADVHGGRSVGRTDPVLETLDPAATPPLIIASMHGLSPSEVLEQFVASNDGYLDVITALDADGWSTLGESPAGHVPIRLLAQRALWDCWVHERDIALPLGFEPPVEDDEVLSCLRYAASLSPAFAISSGEAIGGVFAVESSRPRLEFRRRGR